MSIKSTEELQKVMRLLQDEKREDLAQYKAKVLNTSLEERRKQGVCWYPVQVVKQHIGPAERWILQVERSGQQENHAFQSGKLVSVFLNRSGRQDPAETLNGVLNNVKGNRMTITLNEEDIPGWVNVNDGKLGVNLLFDEAAYREMNHAMRQIIAQDAGRLFELRETLLGKRVATFGQRQLPQAPPPNLNASQIQALEKAFNAQDVAVVHGPPGTGKTTTLVGLIQQVLQVESQVLVCAPSNAAVDLLVEKLTQAAVPVVRLGHPARIDEAILNQTIDAQIAQHSSYSELKNVRKKAEAMKAMAMKYKRKFGHAERQQRRLLLQEASQLRDQAEHLEYYILNDVLTRNKVVACTLVGASSYLIKDSTFSTVFIDEAAQALEPATWIPVLKAKRVILAGDHCQLPPTIKSMKAAHEGLEQTLFEKCIERVPNAATLLRTQYRMHQDIMGFSSQYFYENQLLAHESVAQHTLWAQQPAMQFIDTAGTGFKEAVDPETLSTYNEEEAAFVLQHLQQLLEQAQLEGQDISQWSIAIIAPYRAQINKLKELMEGHRLLLSLSETLSINTVDAFQGQERDLIYISLTRANEKGQIGFLAEERRMNVAMTRARKKLVMVGDSGTIGQNDFFAEILDYVNQVQGYSSAFEYMSM